MAREITQKGQNRAPNSCEFFSLYFKSCPDIGFAQMLFDIALLPPDPFKPRERRKFKRGFVATMLLLFIAVAWFIYFSLPPLP